MGARLFASESNYGPTEEGEPGKAGRKQQGRGTVVGNSGGGFIRKSLAINESSTIGVQGESGKLGTLKIENIVGFKGPPERTRDIKKDPERIH